MISSQLWWDCFGQQFEMIATFEIISRHLYGQWQEATKLAQEANARADVAEKALKKAVGARGAKKAKKEARRAP